MTDEEELFCAALEVPLAERDAFLRQACGGDEAVLERLRTLVHAHAEPNTLLANPAVGLPPAVVAGEVPPAVGPYELLDPIGEGGMGVVYRAQQTEPVRRGGRGQADPAGREQQSNPAR